ncbi:nitrate- and nitrite sensing domain-containing protein [Streptomyces sp. NBC_00249]|uniref:sensor histidine kinase n=1 Tax=Streptomyces sp. NBC_00249 TaxID=2975690 RepID=UPI002254BDB1|nr:nitrate- and nitrite sensing domain-containing protein [Streptomyces sp. NBC_00249]MCX5197994.1 nitrate- and nitrite sensing domain-containing protein [Streptomyces sp. NBC_00249]
MRFRGKSIRRKIVALLLVPLVSLTALWGFATVITGREALQLLDVAYVIDKVGYPVEDVVRVIQKERRQTLVLVGDPRSVSATAELVKSRTATDRVVREITANAADPEVLDELSPQASERLHSILDAFHGIAALRRSVDAGALDPSQALELYSRLVDPCYEFLMNLHALENVEMDRQGRALVGVTRARETLSREDAVIASALAAGNVTPVAVRQVTDFAAKRALHYELDLAVLPADDRKVFEQFWAGPETKALRDAEERFITGGAGKNPRAASPAQWDEAANKVLGDLATMGTEAGDRYQKRVEPVAVGVMVQAAVAGVLGFIALAVSLVLSVRIGRDLVRDLSQLRKDAHEASGVRLPAVMRRLAAGEPVDVETEAPRLEFEKDEVGQVGQALNTLQRAAVEAAVKQAELRRGVSEVFVNLARRNQVLLHRQLTLLDTMERRTEDTEELADLFRLDHMTTRMRRHAEGLVILSGAAPSRQWRKPVQLMDVVRAAVAEVEDYERIEVRRLPRLGIEGPAVADVTHLVAELLENATVFSPPHTAVQVHGERVANGFTLEIHDRGLGMNPEALLDANLRLAETPDFELSDTDRLGLFVVSRLARRHNIRVVLQPSPYGGTTAVVFLPAELLTEAPDTNGTGIRLDGLGGAAAKGAKNLKAAAGAKGLGRRPAPAGVESAPQARPLPAGALNGPVELEGPLGLLGIEGLEGPGRLDGLDPADALDPAALDGPVTGISGLTGVGGRPPMATLDDETPPGGIPRSALLGLRPADRPHPDRPHAERPHSDRPHGDRHPERGGWKGDRIGDRSADRHRDWDRARDADQEADTGRGPARTRGADRERDREPLAPTGPVRLERSRVDTARPDGVRPSGAVPLPRRRPTPTLVAEHGRRVEPRPAAERPAPPEPGGAAAPGGLPRRVRQASLAPQLKDAPAAAAAEAPEQPLTDRDAEDVRRRMSALQRGWTAGRDHHAQQKSETGDGTSAAGGPAHENEGDGR